MEAINFYIIGLNLMKMPMLKSVPYTMKQNKVADEFREKLLSFSKYNAELTQRL